MKRNRFQTPPDTIAAARDSSLVLRLNLGFFLRQLGIFLIMDLLLCLLTLGGVVLYAEDRCADAAALVAERGVPTQEAMAWMGASDYTITPLDRETQGYDVPVLPWFPPREETAQGLRSWELWASYTVELPNGGEPYAVRVELSGIAQIAGWVGAVLLICQGGALLTGLFGNHRAIRNVLRPIQDLAATATRLNSMAHMSREELENLAEELEKIDAKALDSRIDLPGTQKELRDLAKAINDMLDRVNYAYQAQMRFVSDASHELRTPIAVIQGYASLLDRWGKSDPEAMQESIDAIRDEAKGMERLVEQLLFLARGDNDSQPVKPEVFDLTAVAEEVLREEEMIHPERMFLPVWDEGVMVNADPGLMKQVLRILMDNGVKYSPPGGRIYLRVSGREDMARVTVQDEGMGIPAESIPHIFERFYRTDQSRDRKTGGTGLGLSIAKWIVERHGGWFEVVSRENVGSRITFLIPLAKMETNQM